MTSTVAVTLLLVSCRSVVPAGAVTVAVLACGPIAEAATSVVATNVARPPARSVTVVAMAPAPDAAPHDEPAVAVQVQVTPVNAGANVSVTVASVAVLGPALVTTSVQVSGAPAATVGALGVLVIARSATSCGVVVTDALSFSGFGSTGALAWRRRRVGHRPERRDAARDRQRLGHGRRHGADRPEAADRVVVPCDAVADTKVTLAGSRSLIVTLVAALGPRLVTAIV